MFYVDKNPGDITDLRRTNGANAFRSNTGIILGGVCKLETSSSIILQGLCCSQKLNLELSLGTTQKDSGFEITIKGHS